jgi:hypothetical protein
MKYLITESKLDSVILQYLDNQDFVIYNNKKKKNNYIYFLNSESDGMSQISVYVNDAIGEVKNWVYVNYDLIEELCDFFSIDKLDSLDIIRVWVSNTLSIKVGRIENAGDANNYHRLIVITE